MRKSPGPPLSFNVLEDTFYKYKPSDINGFEARRKLKKTKKKKLYLSLEKFFKLTRLDGHLLLNC